MNQIKALAAELRELGWTLRRGAKHDQYRCPCGQHILTMPRANASNQNGDRHSRSLMNDRRTIKACPGQQPAEESAA